MSTLLWLAWVLAFAVLERIGLKDKDDESYTLTNRIRALMRNNVHRWIVRAALALGLVWLAYHFLLVDPTLNPGA